MIGREKREPLPWDREYADGLWWIRIVAFSSGGTAITILALLYGAGAGFLALFVVASVAVGLIADEAIDRRGKKRH